VADPYFVGSLIGASSLSFGSLIFYYGHHSMVVIIAYAASHYNMMTVSCRLPCVLLFCVSSGGLIFHFC
jgi:hypothetical protein